MSISSEQREKNTHNKLKHVVEEAKEHLGSEGKSSSGYLGRRLSSMAKAVKMDEDTRSHDYSGGPEENKYNRNALNTILKEATTNKKRRALTKLMDYGEGHNMKYHGEGKPYGET